MMELLWTKPDYFIHIFDHFLSVCLWDQKYIYIINEDNSTRLILKWRIILRGFPEKNQNENPHAVATPSIEVIKQDD